MGKYESKAMSYVSSLGLRYFRSYKAVDLSVDARPVVIHGQNGAGKTNLLEAISLLSPGRGMRRSTSEELVRRPDALGWRINAEVVLGSQTHEIAMLAEGGTARQLRINDKVASQSQLGSVLRVLWLVPAMDRLWIEGAEGRRRFLDRMTLSFVPEHADVSLTYEKAMRERNRLLKDQVRDVHWYRAIERQMAEAGAAILANRARALGRLVAAQAAATSAFPVAELESIDEGPANAEGLANAMAEGRGRDMAAGRTLVGPHRSDLSAVYQAKEMPAKDCSTGEQKALLVSLILANARALAEEGANPVLLLDEVSAHLDAGRRAALYDEICTLGAQAWMTGTGPELFTELGARAQYIEVADQSGVSSINIS